MKKFIFIFCLLVSTVSAQAITETNLVCLSNNICTFMSPTENGYDFYLVNRAPNANITRSITLNLSLKNLKSDLVFPQYYVLRSSDPIRVTQLSVENETKEIFYSVSVIDYLGDWDAIHDDTVTYSLPFPKGIRSRIGQGYNGHFTHVGALQYSIDFTLPIGTPIHSARRGRVVQVVKKYTEGGIRNDLLSKANSILIQHDDGTIGNYAHLKKDGVVVNEGDYVEEGQLIGYSGNTGYSQGPHLHFEVHKPKKGSTVETIPTFFKTQYSDREYLNYLYLYWQPEKGIDPPNTDLLDEDILLCRKRVNEILSQCNDRKFRLGEMYALQLEFNKPTIKQVELFLTIDGNTVEPYYQKWNIRNENLLEYRYFTIPKNRNFVGNWKMVIKVDGEEKKKFFFQIDP